MNASDWFALDSLYQSAPKDSIHPFLEIFSRCLIGNRLNRPDISIPAFGELLNSQSLDLTNLVSSVYMFGMDLSRVGNNAEAASMISAIVAQTEQYLDSATIGGLTATAKRYAALADYHPYQIEFPEGRNAVVPFAIVPVGPEEKHSVLMQLGKSSINGQEADITFDTGAGTNIISVENGREVWSDNSGGDKAFCKVGRSDGYVAMAKELRLGDILIKDVPFTVVSLSSGNEEADRYIDCFNIVVGGELMLQLKDLTLDFKQNHIIVPTEAPSRSAVKKRRAT